MTDAPNVSSSPLPGLGAAPAQPFIPEVHFHGLAGYGLTGDGVFAAVVFIDPDGAPVKAVVPTGMLQHLIDGLGMLKRQADQRQAERASAAAATPGADVTLSLPKQWEARNIENEQFIGVMISFDPRTETEQNIGLEPQVARDLGRALMHRAHIAGTRAGARRRLILPPGLKG